MKCHNTSAITVIACSLPQQLVSGGMKVVLSWQFEIPFPYSDIIGKRTSESDISQKQNATPRSIDNWRKMELRNLEFSCTFPVQRCKSLIINVAGEWNRTLVTVPDAKYLIVLGKVGRQSLRSTKQTERQKALQFALEMERAARTQSFTEAQARKVLDDLLDRLGEGEKRKRHV